MPICITNIFYVDKLSPFLIDMITQQNSQSESVCVLTAGIVLKEQKIYISKSGENQETENYQRMRKNYTVERRDLRNVFEEEFSFMYVVMVKFSSIERGRGNKKKGEGMVQNLGDKRIGFPKVRNDSSFMETQR